MGSRLPQLLRDAPHFKVRTTGHESTEEKDASLALAAMGIQSVKAVCALHPGRPCSLAHSPLIPFPRCSSCLLLRRHPHQQLPPSLASKLSSKMR